MAQLIPVGIRMVKKAFRKRSVSKQPEQAHPSNTEALNNNDEHHALEDNG